MMTERQQKIRQKVRYLHGILPYLEELSTLIGREVNRESLSALDATADISQRLRTPNRFPKQKVACLFAEKESVRFKRFVERLKNSNPAEVYIWTPRSEWCGYYETIDLAGIKFDFPFSVNSDGILSFVTEDFLDSLTLDFFIEDDDREMIEIIVYGKHWSSLKYDLNEQE